MAKIIHSFLPRRRAEVAVDRALEAMRNELKELVRRAKGTESFSANVYIFPTAPCVARYDVWSCRLHSEDLEKTEVD